MRSIRCTRWRRFYVDRAFQLNRCSLREGWTGKARSTWSAAQCARTCTKQPDPAFQGARPRESKVFGLESLVLVGFTIRSYRVEHEGYCVFCIAYFVLYRNIWGQRFRCCPIDIVRFLSTFNFQLAKRSVFRIGTFGAIGFGVAPHV